MTPLEAAHRYVKTGWRVVPLWGVDGTQCRCPRGAACPSAGKHPHGRGGTWNVLKGGSDVQAWFEDNANDNVGILTGKESGIFVLDIDGATGVYALAQLLVEHGQMPTTRMVETGSGGIHYVFKHPDFTVYNSASTIAPNIDIRGKGGQVVAPPSVSGRGAYRATKDIEPVEAPEWLLKALRAHTELTERGSRVEVKAGELVDLSGVPDQLRGLLEEVVGDGQRHKRLHAIVGACFDAGYNQGQTVTLVTPWCKAVGKFVGREPQEVARSWGKIEAEAKAQDDWLGVTTTPTPAPEIPDLEADEEADFWRARPLLTHLHTFSRARHVAPWAVLGATLARIVVGTPFLVTLPAIVGGRASLNLFVGLVGRSGSGKGAAEAVAADAIRMDPIVSHNVGSGEGIAHGYMHRVKGVLTWNDDNHAVLFSVPEIDSLAAQGDRKGATLMPQLRSGWTGEQLGFGYADPMKRILIPAREYRMALIAGIQPGRAGCLLDDSDGGTPQRFLWMPATDPGAPDEGPKEPAPLTWSAPRFKNTVWGQEMEVCETARKAIRADRNARLRGEDSEALDGHALLAQLKTAAALAIADGRYDVNDEDWHLAGVIARKSAATRAGVAEYLRRKNADSNFARAEGEAHRAIVVDEKLTDAALQRACRTIVRKLRRSGGSAPHRVLRNSVPSKDRGNFEAAIELLTETGQVVADVGERTTTYSIEVTA